MLDFEQINILGNILESSWGKSADDTFSCKAKMQGNKIIITYSTFANLASERAISLQTPALERESIERIASLITDAKKKFKEESGSALKLEEKSNTDSVQVTQASMVNPRRIILYRREAIFEVG